MKFRYFLFLICFSTISSCSKETSLQPLDTNFLIGDWYWVEDESALEKLTFHNNGTWILIRTKEALGQFRYEEFYGSYIINDELLKMTYEEDYSIYLGGSDPCTTTTYEVIQISNTEINLAMISNWCSKVNMSSGSFNNWVKSDEYSMPEKLSVAFDDLGKSTGSGSIGFYDKYENLIYSIGYGRSFSSRPIFWVDKGIELILNAYVDIPIVDFNLTSVFRGWGDLCQSDNMFYDAGRGKCNITVTDNINFEPYFMSSDEVFNAQELLGKWLLKTNVTNNTFYDPGFGNAFAVDAIVTFNRVPVIYEPTPNESQDRVVGEGDLFLYNDKNVFNKDSFNSLHASTLNGQNYYFNSDNSTVLNYSIQLEMEQLNKHNFKINNIYFKWPNNTIDITSRGEANFQYIGGKCVITYSVHSRNVNEMLINYTTSDEVASVKTSLPWKKTVLLEKGKEAVLRVSGDVNDQIHYKINEDLNVRYFGSTIPPFEQKINACQ